MRLPIVQFFYEPSVNHLSRLRVTGQGFRVFVRIGKYTLQMSFSGIRTRD